MINVTEIEQTLIKLDMKYTSATDGHDQILYSKLALLELSGWIEVSFDDILYSYLNRHVSSSYYELCDAKFIKRNNGIHWDRNTRLMIAQVIGVVHLETIETLIEERGGIAILSSNLDILTRNRNKAAHTHTQSFMTYEAPSSTLHKFRLIKNVMVEIQDLVNYL